jgi:hypothetical protein
MIANIKYTHNRRVPVAKVPKKKNSRTIDMSQPKYSAIPAQTPKINLLDDFLSFDIML